jgi:hypothetical protein
MCHVRRLPTPCFVCWTWPGKRPARLSVRPHLRGRPMPAGHSDASALLILSLSRGWDEDGDNIVADLPLAYAKALPFWGQA